jgi:hypothetical protein
MTKSEKSLKVGVRIRTHVRAGGAQLNHNARRLRAR